MSLALALGGCGGGDGGGVAATDSPRPETLSLSANELVVTSRVGEAAPVLSLTITVNDLGTPVYG